MMEIFLLLTLAKTTVWDTKMLSKCVYQGGGGGGGGGVGCEAIWKYGFKPKLM